MKITLKQRQMWARVAAYMAQAVNSIAKSFDENEVDKMFDILKRTVHEAEAYETAEEYAEEKET